MSEAIPFDTHKSFKHLVKAGIPEQQAEAIIDCQPNSQSELATKANLETAIAKLEVRLIKWMVGLAIGIVASQTALTVALIKPLP